MIVNTVRTTGDGRKTFNEKIKLMDGREPHFNEHSKLWFVPGYRWIKATQKFSSNALLHHCQTFTPDEG